MQRRSAVVATIVIAALLAAGCLMGQNAEPEGAPPGTPAAAVEGEAPRPDREDAGGGHMPADNAKDDPVLSSALIERREELMAALREQHPLTEQEENAYRKMIAEYDLPQRFLRTGDESAFRRMKDIRLHIHASWQETLPILHEVINDMLTEEMDDELAHKFYTTLDLLPSEVPLYPPLEPEYACANELGALIAIPFAFHHRRELRLPALSAAILVVRTRRWVECDCLEPPLRAELRSRARSIIHALTEDEDRRIWEMAREARYEMGEGPRPEGMPY